MLTQACVSSVSQVFLKKKLVLVKLRSIVWDDASVKVPKNFNGAVTRYAKHCCVYKLFFFAEYIAVLVSFNLEGPSPLIF